MDYHSKFFGRLSKETGRLPWTGWIKAAFRDEGVILESIPKEELDKIVRSMSSLIAGLVQCQKKRTYIELLGQEMKKYFDDLRERKEKEN